jgi:two-component system, LytTR family, response regulator
MKIRVAIADDEAPARQILREYLAFDPEIEIVVETGDGASTIREVRRLRPDLLFLDIEMPEGNGLQVVEAIGTEQLPAVVFVTAYDDYAIRAFEVQAIEYLVKPFDLERFQSALDHAKRQVQARNPARVMNAIREALDRRPGGSYPARLGVRGNGRVVVLNVADIDWVEADGNNVNLHVGNTVHVMHRSMREIEERLDPDKFARIHRSTIVNVSKIRDLQAWFTGEYIVRLKGGRELTMTRRYRDHVLALLGVEQGK